MLIAAAMFAVRLRGADFWLQGRFNSAKNSRCGWADSGVFTQLAPF